MSRVLRVSGWVGIGASIVWGLYFTKWVLVVSIMGGLQVAGVGGVALALTSLPPIFLTAPWIALFSMGYWYPCAIIYGGGGLSLALLVTGKALGRKRPDGVRA